MPRVVPTSEVAHSEGYLGKPIRLEKVKEILQRQGLIEPLILKRGTMQLRGETWDDERLSAARELGWDTVIVTDGTY